jgi:outer membrane autotransporter protein
MLNKIKSLILIAGVLSLSAPAYSTPTGEQEKTIAELKRKTNVQIADKDKQQKVCNQLKETFEKTAKILGSNTKFKEISDKLDKLDKLDKRKRQLSIIEKAKTPSKVEAVSGAVFTALDQTLSVARQGLSAQEAQVASGEGDTTNGAWVKGFFGNSKNKNRMNTEFKGGSIGYQNRICENLFIGGAVSVINLESKLPSAREVDTVNYYIGSLYTAIEMESTIISGAIFWGAGNGKAKAVNAKTKDTVYGMQAGAAYKIAIEEGHLITPVIDVKWLSMNSKQTPNGEASVNSSGNVINGSAEVKYAYSIENGNMKIVPSVSVGANNNFSNSLKQEGKKLDIAKGPAMKFFTTLDLTAKGESVDFGIGGKYEMAKKFHGYTAVVSVSARF